MITQLTPNDQLLSELKQDYDKARYWYNKQYHGEKNYERAKRDRAIKARRLQQDQIGEIVDYHSPNGNRWKVVDICRYFEETGQTHDYTYAFLYWETYGSVGSVLPRFSIKEQRFEGALIFTSHFYLRLADRKKISGIDANLVLAFMIQNPCMLSQPGKDEKGYDCIDMKSKDGLCRGYFRTDEEGNRFDDIIEMRTFLNDVQLTNKQKRDTKRLRDNVRFVDDRPYELIAKSIIESDNMSEALNEQYEREFRALGAPKGFGADYSHAQQLLFWLASDYNEHPKKRDIENSLELGKRYGKVISAPLQKLVYEKGRKFGFADLLEIWINIIPDFDCNKAYRRYVVWCFANEDYSREKRCNALKELDDWFAAGNSITKDNYRMVFSR